MILIIDSDRELRKQKDDDYQSKEIKRDLYGISYDEIEKERKKGGMKGLKRGFNGRQR